MALGQWWSCVLHGVLPVHGFLACWICEGEETRRDAVRKRGMDVTRRSEETHLSHRSNTGATPAMWWPKP